MKRNDKIFIVAFIVIVSFSLLYLFQASYAKYRKQLLGELNTTVASWNILVNNEMINNSSTLSNDIIPTIDANQYVKTGVIAPGSTGYFTITIDATNVDVDFSYEIEAEPDNSTPLYDLVLSHYVIGNTTYNFTDDRVITGDLTKNTGTLTITVYFEWDDNPTTNIMDNQSDTEYAIDSNNTNTKINVSIHFTQKRS